MAVPQIVVGVDGSDGSREALEWALEEARLRDTEVVAVYAWVLELVGNRPATIDSNMLQDRSSA